MSDDIRGWNTTYELAFVRKLGTHSAQGAKIGAKELKRRYAIAMTRRSKWGAIDRFKVREELKT